MPPSVASSNDGQENTTNHRPGNFFDRYDHAVCDYCYLMEQRHR